VKWTLDKSAGGGAVTYRCGHLAVRIEGPGRVRVTIWRLPLGTGVVVQTLLADVPLGATYQSIVRDYAAPWFDANAAAAVAADDDLRGGQPATLLDARRHSPWDEDEVTRGGAAVPGDILDTI